MDRLMRCYENCCCSRLAIACLLAALIIATPPAAHGKDRPRIDPRGIGGTVVLAGGGALDASVLETLRTAVGADGQLLVVTTAHRRAGDAEFQQRQLERWRTRGFSNVMLLHAENREQANRTEFCAPLATARAVWFCSGRQQRIVQRYEGTQFHRELEALLARGGVVGGNGGGAAALALFVTARAESELSGGLQLLPDAFVAPRCTQRARTAPLRAALLHQPQQFGVGIDERTAIVVHGRRMRAIGQGTVTLLLADLDGHEPYERVLERGDQADLTALRRAARQRGESPFPPPEFAEPRVPHGALIIVGGGSMPKNIVERFIELAGGPDAQIVVLPTALPDPLPDDDGSVAMFARAGAANVHVLRARTWDEVQSAEFAATLRAAQGVWFGGGRQWRFIDAYQGTQAVELLHDVLRRGGVIGGSSAGASIQAEFLVRGDPLGNQQMLAPGYLRGLGFLPGTAIDQHFSQRNRFADLAAVVQRHPQLLGLGIDEATALVVQHSVGQVLGRGSVYLYANRPADSCPGAEGNAATAPLKVDAGQLVDLVERRLVGGH